jgi:hypothetical protein
VNTGNLDLAFVDDQAGDPPTPFTDDDNKVDDNTKDPNDVGYCNIGKSDDDGDNKFDEDGDAGGSGHNPNVDDDGDQAEDGTVDVNRQYQCFDGLDNDGDGDIDAADPDCQNGIRVDEDPHGSIVTSCDPRSLSTWVVPDQAWSHTSTDPGPDRGITDVYVDVDTLQVFMYKPSVRPSGGYSPTVHFQVTDYGTVPIVITEIDVTLPYELWDTNNDNVINDVGNDGDCVEGEPDCAPAVDAILTGLEVGDTVWPFSGPAAQPPIDATLQLVMTPATNPGEIYAVTIVLTGHQYNEP